MDVNREWKSIIVSWMGGTDVKAAQEHAKDDSCPPGDCGPVRTLTDSMDAETVYLLVSREFARYADEVCSWVARGTSASCRAFLTDVDNPADYEEVYRGAEAFFAAHWKRSLAERFVYNVTPGTPAMQAIMLYLGQVRYAGGRTVRVARPETGPTVIDVRLPFSLALGGDTPSGVPLADQDALDEVIRTFAPVRAVNILLLGETGTGKSRFARQIHAGSGDPADRFRAVNCAALAAGDGNLFRSELFGHKKGSFTGADRDKIGAFEEAEGGTLFLDEIGEIPFDRQAILLRALEEGMIEPVGGRPRPLRNVRIISATNRNLMEEVRAGRFRQDLFYRLAMCPVTLQPVRRVIAADQQRFRLTVTDMLAGLKDGAPELRGEWSVTDDGWRVLTGYSWPGNWRELRHVLLLACASALGRGRRMLDASTLERRLAVVRPLQVMQPLDEGDPSMPLEAWLETLKARRIQQALERSGGNKREASRLLGLDYQKLVYYLKNDHIRDTK